MATRVDRKAQLGAYPVGACDQNGPLVTARQLHQRAETADAGEHLRPHGAPGEWLDRLDEGVAGIHVDAGIAVRDSFFRHARVRGAFGVFPF